MKLVSYGLQSKCYGDPSYLCVGSLPGVPGVRVCFFFFLAPVVSLLPMDIPMGPFSSQPHFCPSYLMNMASSTHVALESVSLQFFFWVIYINVDVI